MPNILRDDVSVNNISFTRSTRRPDGSLVAIDNLVGWDSSPEPTVAATAFGYSDGVAAADRFPLKEKYVEVGGWIEAPTRLIAESIYDDLIDLFNPDSYLSVIRLSAIPKLMNMRAVSAVELLQDFGTEKRWAVRLMADWPYKLSPAVATGEAQAFAGGVFQRTYSQVGSTSQYARYYTLDSGSGRYYRTYDPGTSGKTVIIVTRTNQATNPNFQTSAVNWNASAGGTTGTITRSIATNDLAIGSGSQVRRIAAAGLGTTSSDFAGDYIDIGAAPGQNKRISLYFARLSGSTTKRGSIALQAVKKDFQTGALTVIGTTYWAYTAALTGTGPIRLAVNSGVLPADTAFLRVTAAFSGNAGSAEAFTGDFDGLLVEENVAGVAQGIDSTPGVYFDGNSANCRWQGTANLSGSEAIQLQQIDPVNIPDSITFNNLGNAKAYPLMGVRGPLPVGGWYIVNETTDERQTFDVDIPAGATLTIDNKEQTATLSGSSVEYYLRGIWLTARPKTANVFRLVVADNIPDARLNLLSAQSTWR